MQSFNKHSLGIHYVSGTVLGSENNTGSPALMLQGSSRDHNRVAISLKKDGPKDLLRMPATSDVLEVLSLKDRWSWTG